MTSESGYPPPPTTSPAGGSRSTTELAREEASGVAESAKQAGGHVAEIATEQAKEVAAETAQQARNLLNETRDQVREQARTGQQKAAEKLSSVADELRGMAEKSDQPGLASDLAVQAADKVRDVASWLQGRDPGELLVEVRNWARRRPAAFLAGAAIAGVLVGRLTRAAAATQSESSTGNGAAQLPVSPQPSAPGGSGLGNAGPSPGYEPSPQPGHTPSAQDYFAPTGYPTPAGGPGRVPAPGSVPPPPPPASYPPPPPAGYRPGEALDAPASGYSPAGRVER